MDRLTEHQADQEQRSDLSKPSKGAARRRANRASRGRDGHGDRGSDRAGEGGTSTLTDGRSETTRGGITSPGVKPAWPQPDDRGRGNPDMATESVRSTDGTRIAYQRVGHGPPLVLVHGTADDHTMWAGLAPALAARFTILTLDRRGRGGSGDAGTYSNDREFEYVATIVDALGEPALLLGHSYGAFCAMEAALRTENVRKLVLYEPPFPTSAGGTISPPGTLARMETLLEKGDREGALLTFAREIARLPEDLIGAMRSTPEWHASVISAHTIGREIRAAEAYVFDPARFRALTQPTLLVLGSESPPFLTEATEAVAAALPHGRLAVLVGQGHRAMETNPDLLLHEVMRFLTEEPNAVSDERDRV